MPSKSERTSEYEYSVATLRYLAGLSSGEAMVATIKRRMPDLLKLKPADFEQSNSRSNELVYQQVVGNIVSHRDLSSENFINRGLLSWRPRYLAITDAGRAFLAKLKG